MCVIIPHWLWPWELGGSLSPSHTKLFANGGNPWVSCWRFVIGFLLTFGVGVVIVVFHSRSMVPICKLCLSLLHSLITLACSRLSECRSNLILPLSLVCVRNNPTLVATLRIGWFIKPFTHQTIFQRRQSWGRLVEVCSLSPTNICCWCLDCGVWRPCPSSLYEALPLLIALLTNSGIFLFAWNPFHFNISTPPCVGA